MEGNKLTTDRKQLQDKLLKLTEKTQAKSQQHYAISVGIGAIHQTSNDLNLIPCLVDLSAQIALEVDRANRESIEIQLLLMGMDN